MKKKSADVTILGGGLAGLTLALQCRQKCPDARITVLEKNKHPVPEAAFKVGESSVEVAAYYFAEVLGFKEHIVEEQFPKLGLRFFFRSGDNRAIERRLELGGKVFAPAPSYQLDRGRFENFLAEQCLERNIEFQDAATVKNIQMGGMFSSHAISYEREGQSHSIESRWLADASGRAGLLKRKLGLQKPSPHKANAVWFRVDKLIKIDEWCDNANWQQDYDQERARWYSTNHLMGEGYWVWLIPLASGSMSIGIVADEQFHPLSSFNSQEKALAWLDKYEPQCAEKIRTANANIQDFLAVKHYSMECKKAFSAQRWGLTGEAGFFLDPFYSPGSDFIGFANTFLSDLIQRDLQGKSFRFRAFLSNRIFKRFFYGTATVYQDQYQLFGNHQIMPVKILWDYMIYWSLTGFLFMNDRACDHYMYPRHLTKILKLGKLNHFMQEYFRQWHKNMPGHEVAGSVDTTDIPIIRHMNERLLDQLDNREFGNRFAENVAQVETLFWEIIDHVGLDVQVPFKRKSYTDTIKKSFQQVFEVTDPNRKETTTHDRELSLSH